MNGRDCQFDLEGKVKFNGHKADGHKIKQPKVEDVNAFMIKSINKFYTQPRQ